MGRFAWRLVDEGESRSTPDFATPILFSPRFDNRLISFADYDSGPYAAGQGHFEPAAPLMTNALSPDRMTAAERLDEVAEILAAGAMRLAARKSSALSAPSGESFLDLPAHQSGHGHRKNRRKEGP
jgi:hypothetical protein